MSTHICPGCREPIPTGAARFVVHDSDPDAVSGEFHSAACWLNATNEDVKYVETVVKNLICDAECVLHDEGKIIST